MTHEEDLEGMKKMLNQFIQVEEEVVSLVEQAISKAENITVKHLLRAIQHDSRKHADLGRAALEILEYKETVGKEERQEVLEMLKKHIDIERKHRYFVTEIKYTTKTPALQYIFQQVWEDEKKHHIILETLMTKRFEKDPDMQWGFLLSS